MAPQALQRSLLIYEMMARLEIELGAGVLPASSLRYATAFRRREVCPSKDARQDWLNRRRRG